MWELETTADYERGLKWYAKKHPRELQAALGNLSTYLKALRAGMKPQHRLFGFMHSEAAGVWAIDQKGGGKDLAQTRLYVYPDERTETLYLVTIGDKGSQGEDVQMSNDFVEELKRGERETDEPPKAENGGQGEEVY